VTIHKIVKVTAGLYRTVDGGYAIMRNHEFVAKDLKWLVTFTNMFGEKVRRKFKTLSVAKAYVNDPNRY
jgi:hypothetical protein